MSTQLAATHVQSSAKPETALLRQSRFLVHNQPELQKLFQESEAKGLDWLRDNLLVRFAAHFGDWSSAVEVCTFLIDEHVQTKGYLPVLNKQGDVLAYVQEDRVYQPPPVLRESGNIVQQSPRLDPNLEASLVVDSHDQAYDKDLMQQLSTRYREDAVELQFRSKVKRASLVERIDTRELIKRLIHSFLGVIVQESFPEEGTLFSTSVTFPVNIPDKVAINSKFDFAAMASNTILVKLQGQLLAHLEYQTPKAQTDSLESADLWTGETPLVANYVFGNFPKHVGFLKRSAAIKEVNLSLGSVETGHTYYMHAKFTCRIKRFDTTVFTYPADI